MTYALGTKLQSRNNDASVRSRHLSSARTPKKNVLSTAARRVATDIRHETLRKEALEEAFAASRERFLRVAYSVLRNKEDAEDAVQDAFLSAHRNLRSFEGRAALTTWLTRIVLNSALMIRRKRKPQELRSAHEAESSQDDHWMENIPDLQPDPEMIHTKHETIQVLEGILGKMKPVLRQALTMTYYDELSGAEACAALGVSFGTFKARLFRARKQILNKAERGLMTPARRTLAAWSETGKRQEIGV